MPIHGAEAFVCESQSSVRGTTAKLRHTFTIKPFSFYQDEKLLNSATFCNTQHDAIKWRINLYPQGWKEEDKEFIAVSIRLDSSTERNVRASFKFSILDAEEKLITEWELPKPHEFKPGQGWGIAQFIRRNQVLDHLEETSTDELSVCVEVQALVNTMVSPNFILMIDPEEFETRAPEALCGIIRERMPADISLIVNDKKSDDNQTVPDALDDDVVFAKMFLQKQTDRLKRAISLACAELCSEPLPEPAEGTIDTECTTATKSLMNTSEENSDSAEGRVETSDTSLEQMTPPGAAEVLESDAQAKASNDLSDDDKESASSSFSIISK